MNYPSVKRLVRDLNIDQPTARQIRGLMDGSIDPYEAAETFPAVDQWIRRCYREPESDLVALYVIDQLLDTYGIEGWTLPGQFFNGVSYCNMGDTYAQTVALVPGGRWLVCDFEYLANRFPSED